MSNVSDCPWLVRVSALCDNELPADQIVMVRAHIKTCTQCSQFAVMFTSSEYMAQSTAIANVKTVGFHLERSLSGRILLGILGCVLLGIAAMNFVNGSVDNAAMHDLRHLGIWQASLGVSVVVLSFWFRLSLFIVSTTTSFLVLTTTAAVFDLMMGHRGPWADATHVIEAFVLLLLLILSWPRARLTIRAGRQLPPIHRDS